MCANNHDLNFNLDQIFRLIQQLAKMNSVFRTIDLLCLLVAPSLAGVIFDFLSYSWAAIFIALWNILSLAVEYYLLFAIYKEFPALSQKKIFLEQEGDEPKKITQCSMWSLPGTNYERVIELVD